jgi:hypothetical protein
MKKLALVNIFAGVIFLLGGTFAVPAAYGATWDVTADFSITNNPNGAWSYGYGPVGLGSFTLFTDTGTFGYEFWDISGNPAGEIPLAGKNTSSTTAFGVAPGEFFLHPYAGDQALAVARWTAPSAGTFPISGSFGTGNTGDMSYYIYQNSILLYSSIDDPDNYTFSFSPSLLAGDTISFAVGPNTAGGTFISGSTPLSATIVPLPPSVLLLSSGLLGLGAVGWRRRKASGLKEIAGLPGKGNSGFSGY